MDTACSCNAGGAVGCALLTYYQYLDNKRTSNNKNDSMKGVSGPSFNNDIIESYLQKNKYPYKKLNDENIAETIADLIAEEKVIGWFEGRMEFGPRVGFRTIIGDADITCRKQ